MGGGVEGGEEGGESRKKGRIVPTLALIATSTQKSTGKCMNPKH